MTDPIIRTGADASLEVVADVRTTIPIFPTACYPQTRARLLNLISNLPVKPPSSGHQTVSCSSAFFASSKLRREPVIYMESRRRCKSQRASANSFNHQGGKRPVEDRGTHLRHSSSFHHPPSLCCASVEPDRPDVYGTPGRSRRLRAYIIPAIDASCDPTSTARCACVCCVCGPCCCCDPDRCPPRAPADDAPCAMREPSLLEPAAISVPSESSPESFACGSALPERTRMRRARIGRKAVASASRRTRCSRCCCRGPPPRSYSRFACSVPLLCRCVGDGGVGDGDDALRVG